MNCDCIGTVEKKMADFMRDRAGDDAEARIKNTAFAFESADDNQSEKLVLALMIPLRVKGSKKGYTSERGKDVPCRASHCPFCGRTTGRYVVGADAGIAAAMQIQ